MKKIVINNCYGGFGLSKDALDFLRLNNVNTENTIERDNPFLIQVVENLEEKANNQYSNLRIVEIPDGVEWEISEYDGMEYVAEKHRKWY